MSDLTLNQRIKAAGIDTVREIHNPKQEPDLPYYQPMTGRHPTSKVITYLVFEGKKIQRPDHQHCEAIILQEFGLTI